MKEDEKLIRVYSGTDLTVNLVKSELEKFGIFGVIQNDFNSGISAGFLGGVSSSIDLFIQESDLKQAQPILKDLVEINVG